MRCEEVRRMLADDEAALADEARRHLTECAACRREAVRWEAVRQELRAMAEEAPPPFLHARIMAHVRAGSTARGPRRLIVRRAWAGPVVVVAVALALGSYGLWRGLHDGPPPPAAPVPPPPASADGASGPGARADARSPESGAVEARRSTGADAAGAADAGSEAAKAARPASGPAAEVLSQEAAPTSSRAEATGRRTAEVSAQAPPAPMVVGAEDWVRCRLVATGGGGPGVALRLPIRAAPPAGGAWTVEVRPGRAATVRDDRGRPVPSDAARAAVLDGLGLAPGRYRLVRAAH